jgi:hypothetical protein
VFLLGAPNSTLKRNCYLDRTSHTVALSFVIPRACDFLISLKGLLWKGRPHSSTTILSLGSGPLPFNHPLLFVIPSEAEGSAVRSIGNQSEMEAPPSPCHPSEAERLSELSSDRQCSTSRVKLKLLHLFSPGRVPLVCTGVAGALHGLNKMGRSPFRYSLSCAAKQRKQKAP